jgi:hypothetical protein
MVMSAKLNQQGARMPNIKPVSDLRNYTTVLRDISIGKPVFLTKSGRGKYVILAIEDYSKTEASVSLMSELAKGRQSGEKLGWETLEDVETSLGIARE